MLWILVIVPNLENSVHTTAVSFDAQGVPVHTGAYKVRRCLNWFPLGLAYASMMFMRYVLNTAKSALGDESMTTSDFNFIFGAGAFCYFLGMMVHSPIIDRRGGRWGMLYGVFGAMVSCTLIGVLLYGRAMLGWNLPLFGSLLVLYSLNMFFQSCAAMSIVTTKLPWFHVRHRGTFSTIFGFMISLGIYFAFDWGYALMDATRATIDPNKLGFWATIFQWLLRTGNTGINEDWWIFFFPALFALTFWVPMIIWLRNTPSDAGYQDFETGDQHISHSSLSLGRMVKELFLNPQHRVLLTIVFIEFCTGAVRNGMIQTYPHFAKAIGFDRSFFVSANWGMVMCLCGFVGAFTTGRISDRYFQSRRGPMSLIYYVLMVLGLIAITMSLMDNSPTHGSWITGVALMVIGTGVIGVHGILSGTATGDFAGIKNTAKSVGIVDGAVYVGTSVQAIMTGMLITQHGDAAKNPAAWIAWPIILIPFAIVGTLLCTKIFHALPSRKAQTVASTQPEPERPNA